ncbi:mitogen-activated protein kinase kinase kinase 20-like [Vicia villosa]|uniref:mitogen-activated protein kinase kinase kinase 20-like n=1 Tax=Vicia villosa TaxID=3911 RepID=UPI00273BB7B3|nr:mitogen-activated protein kinase kinase kinase 20-like [Vicia villosa]
MNWVRGDFLGSGSFATVNLAKHIKPSVNIPSLTAVKSCEFSHSLSLQKEKNILERLRSCPHIIHCFGHDLTIENGEEYYNIFLEYANCGTLNDQLKNYDGKLPEKLVRRYTRSVVKGLKYIHENGFVHCDLKPPNILVFDNDNVKISDFGLAKEMGVEEDKKMKCKGTPMFMSPEAVMDNVYESPVDIWALGCTVLEILTGEPAWDISYNTDPLKLLVHIGVSKEVPLIPEKISEEAKDFLEKCLVRDPLKRWSAEMLLKHPFISDDETVSSVKESTFSSTSPVTHFGFSNWSSSTVTTLPYSSIEADYCFLSQEKNLLDCWPEEMLTTSEKSLDLLEYDEWCFVISN